MNCWESISKLQFAGNNQLRALSDLSDLKFSECFVWYLILCEWEMASDDFQLGFNDF